MADQWWTTEEVAARYRVPVATVRQWRHKGMGPQGIRCGRYVRYSEAALGAWETAQANESRRAS